MENKRRDFLKTACAPVVFSMFGVGMLEACSSGDDDGYGTPPAPGNASNSGEDQEEKSITIDLTKSDFSKISDVGGWMNYTAKNLLLVRVSETTIRAFNNACPHEGVRTRWTFNGTRFQCHEHNRTFNINCNGSLNCYNTTIEGSTLTISNTN